MRKRYYIAHPDSDVSAVYVTSDDRLVHGVQMDCADAESAKAFRTWSKTEAEDIALEFSRFGARVVSYYAPLS